VRENDARWGSRIGSLGFRDEMLVGAKEGV
jgi:hypothetical protein